MFEIRPLNQTTPSRIDLSLYKLSVRLNLFAKIRSPSFCNITDHQFHRWKLSLKCRTEKSLEQAYVYTQQYFWLKFHLWNRKKLKYPKAVKMELLLKFFWGFLADRSRVKSECRVNLTVSQNMDVSSQNKNRFFEWTTSSKLSSEIRHSSKRVCITQDFLLLSNVQVKTFFTLKPAA